MIQSLSFLSSAKPASSPPLPSRQRLDKWTFPPFPTGGGGKNEENPDKKGLMRNNGSRPLPSFPHREIIKKQFVLYAIWVSS